MIETVEVWNFQPHDHILVDFSRAIVGLSSTTTLLGNNQSGKSSILRALRWIFLNEGSVKELMQVGKSWFRATAVVDGHKITRKYGPKGRNIYRLDGKELKAFHPAVPKPIADLLAVTEDNFQGQLDAPYWFLDTPGQVSRKLNKIVNLEVIDSTLKAGDQAVRQAKSRVELTKERLARARAEKKELSWVKIVSAETSRLKSLQETRVKIQTNQDALTVIMGKLHELKRQRIQPPPSLKRIKAMSEALVKIQNQLAALGNLHNDLQQVKDLIWQAQMKLRQAENDLKRMTDGKCPTCGRSLVTF